MTEEEVISGRLNIGAGETKNIKHLFRVFKDLKSENDNISLMVKSANSDDILMDLDMGLLDMALTIGFVDTKKHESLLLPWQDSWGLLMRKDLNTEIKKSIHPQELSEYPLIVSGQSLVLTEMKNWWGLPMENLNIIAQYNLLYNASIMAEEGMGAVLCLDGIINTENSDLVFLPLEPEIKSPNNLIWKKNQKHSRLAKKFLENIREYIYEDKF